MRQRLSQIVFCSLLSGWAVTAAGYASAEDDDTFKRIKLEETFVKIVVGKRLIYETGAVVVFVEDKTFAGDFSGSKIWGEWVWRDDKICHQMNVGEKRYKVDCRVPVIDGRKIRFIREDGTYYGTAKIRGPES